MSSVLAPALPAAEPRSIRIVSSRTQRRARPKTLYAVVVVIGLFVVLLCQLGLSIGLGDGAYEIASLKGEARALDRKAATLTETIESLSSPQNLAANAEALGMVANSSPVYLRLSDGKVLGRPTAASSGAGIVQGSEVVQNSTTRGFSTVSPTTATGTATASATATDETETAGAPEETAVTAEVALPDGTIAGPNTH